MWGVHAVHGVHATHSVNKLGTAAASSPMAVVEA
jgi:hypothetical protein